MRGSTDQGSDQAVTLADAVREDAPAVTLAVLGAGCGEDPCILQIHHDGVNGSLVAAGIQSHAAHKVAAGLGSLLDQGRTHGGADDGAEVHRSGVVNCRYPTGQGSDPSMGGCATCQTVHQTGRWGDGCL